MTPAQVAEDDGTALVPKHRVVPAGDSNDVMREQLDFLIDHVEQGVCGCGLCSRYLAVKDCLLDVFKD